jgi:hypothetical protein
VKTSDYWVEAFRISAGGIGYDDGFRWGVEVYHRTRGCLHRWHFVSRDAAEDGAQLLAQNWPCAAYLVLKGQRVLLCTAIEANAEFISGRLLAKIVDGIKAARAAEEVAP